MNSQVIAGLVFGGAIGFFFVGYLMKPVLLHWEGSATTRRTAFAIATFFGGGIALTILKEGAEWYLVGAGVGIVLGCFHKPILIIPHTLESIFQVLQLGEAYRSRARELEQRAALILAVLVPPKSTKKSQVELGEELDKALDEASEVGGK